MELFSVDKSEYEKIVKENQYVYNSVWFHSINHAKVDELYYLLFKAKKYKFSVIAGIKDGAMKFPYSAPFSIIEAKTKDVSLEEIEETLQLLEKFAKEHNVNQIMFRLPPVFYDENYISKFQNCLLRCDYEIAMWDLNYQYYIRNMDYLRVKLKRNARKNLRIAQKNEYHLVYCKNKIQKKQAYDVIAENRKSKGYPLRMTWQQICKTIQYIQHDFFLLYLESKVVAAAIIFRVNDDVYQVIYWGDLMGYSEYKPMNYLSYYLYEYYCKKGIKVLDIGPSTENGIPNYGLCSFKESIGCEVSSKVTYIKNL